MTTSLKVAVIGAGISGLLAVRELQREAHRVVVFEKSQRLGGTWVYDPRVEADHLDLNPDRETVHSSLYYSLRTNLPRLAMGFSDYSLEAREYGDPRNFPGHEEVLKFLEDFATEFRLTELIRFNTEVVRVELGNDEWVVESKTCGSNSEQVFDAVVVCSGHHTEPRVATDIPGIDKWPRKQVHSHNYRVPEPFRDQIVVIIGSGPSAVDISRDIAKVAKEVHLSSRSPDVKVAKLDRYNNVWQHSKINYVYEDGRVAFLDGSTIEPDIIFHCTGYKFHFPFLRTNGTLRVENDRVGPLYKHIFPPKIAPRLSFIGLPSRSVITRMLELQSKWVAQVLSGKVLLPSEEEMMADVEEHYRQMKENGILKHHTHSLDPFVFDYLDWLADQVGSTVEDRVKEVYMHTWRRLMSNLDGLRDEANIVT